MAHEVKTEIIIQASPEKIWKIFSDFDNYPNWNPFIQYIKGPVEVGNKIKVSIMDMPFKPTVLKCDEMIEFRWKGHLIVPGIFDGEHYFILENLGNGTIRFHHGELFSGILVPLFKKQLNTKVKAGYEAMNVKLKELSER